MLRIRTGYSFRSAAGMIKDVMERIKECEYPAAVMTDRASVFGWVKWSKLAKASGIRPVFGVELAVTDSIHAKKPSVDYWTFVAKDNVQDINRLVELATQQFRYEPLLTYEQAQAANVFKIVGHRSLLQYVHASEDLWVGLSPSSTRGYISQALKQGLQLAGISDNKFACAGDEGFYETVCGRGASIQTYDQHIQTAAEWLASVERTGVGAEVAQAAWGASAAILQASTAGLLQASILHPNRPATLRQMCLDGAKRTGCDLSNPVYAARMDRELKLIADKEFEDYFYIVADICQFARRHMIVGPARGSSCGSLVCYLLNITTIDPLPYGLIFERFIDINRSDLPDIDIDFSDQQRHLVFEYLNDKYGSDRVARLGTVALFKPKSAMQEAGASLRVPRWKITPVAESLIERMGGDSRALQTFEDTIASTPAGKALIDEFPEMMVAARMEGHPRHSSQHAAGIVLCSEPVSKYIAIDHRTGATMCDKYDAETLNFLKIDALGLTQLSVFENALEMAKLPRDTLENIDLNDAEAFKILNDGKFSGIFQFNGVALQRLVRQSRVDSLDDIVSITALGRPGPLASGGAEEWVNRRIGVSPIKYPHPLFEPYLNDTLGIIIYQEQVMEIARNIGDLSWEDVTALRKAMSKSLGKEFFDQYGNPWKTGAIAKGVDPKEAEKVWDDLCAYGSWSFNKSHSVAYGIISYQCCWLKAHYPFEFAAATLTHESDPDRQIMLLREMAAEGFDYVPVDKDYSTDKWSVGYRENKKVLVGPLSNVAGIGPKMVNSIIGARARGERMPERAQKLLLNAKTPIDSLFPVRDAFRRVLPDPGARNIITPPSPIIKIVIEPYEQTIVVFCIFVKIDVKNENDPVYVARRGYEIKDGFTTALNLQIADDTDIIFGKVNRFQYAKIGKEIVDRGGVGKHLYVVKGKVRAGGSFRMLSVDSVRYIGPIKEGK